MRPLSRGCWSPATRCSSRSIWRYSTQSWEYLSFTIFKLVSRIPDGLGELRNLLENHITNQGLAAIEKLGDEALNDPKIYVSTILEVHRKYNALVLTAFNNDAGFVASLDKACGEFQSFNGCRQIWFKVNK